MSTYRAYCSVCDAEVEVAFEGAGGEPERPVHVRCLGRHSGCDGETCPLPAGEVDGEDPDVRGRLRRHLEFVPLEIRKRGPRTLGESAVLIEEARRASLARQFWRFRL